MPPDSRLREVNKMKRCTNCLRRGHSKSDCRSQGCKKCNGRHNTLLHDDSLRNPPATSGVARSGGQNASNSQIQGSDSDDSIVHGNNDDNSVQSAGLAVNHCRNLEPQILLSTANILIKDGSNRWHECRALLDSGSQPNFITTRLMSQLTLDSTDAGIPVIGVGNSTTRIAKQVRTEIKSLNNDYSVKLTFLVLDEITECMPNFPFNKTELKIPKTVKLADSNFYLSSTIDILLGAGIFFDLLCSGRIKLGENLPVLQQTLLGWIISGPLPREINSSSNFCNLAIEASLDKQIEKFWLLEEVTTQKPQSREEIECENVFVETTRRDDSGHFVVTLPTRENRIVWRKNETDEIGHYRLNTVTYGTASASFLAVRSLQQVAHEHHESYPHAAEAILSDFYVDDLITGANDIESTINLKHDISILLDSYGFPLRKWLSNSPHILEDSIDNDNCYIMSDDDTRKTLGLLWCCTSDTLEYRVNEKDFALPRLSKRTMLSAISKIFDPLGIISPVIITVKILIQELWQLKISWDDSVPSSIRNTWMTFTENLTTLCEIKLPRQVMLHNASRIELHGFCSIVLCWISAPPNTWKLFVSNRISKIQGSTDVSQWKHVASADNPADLVSRGISASQLPSCKIWWHGPVWLNKSEKEWPEPLYQARNKIEIEHVPEKRHLQVSLIAKHDFSILDRYSSLYRLQKIVAFCFRFTYNASNSFGERKSGAITVDEMNHALLALVKLAQHQDFSQEINCLFEKKPLPKGSRLLNLDPFLDTNGYLRVGGRLSKSNLPFDTKHPLILGAKNKLTSLIIKNEHHRQLHAGCQSILSTLRQRFWPLGGRQTVRRAINKCLTCFRIKPNLLIRKMADLPAERVTQNRPFVVVGMDFAGPFSIKDGRLRNRAIIKAYLCIFICFSTKAVHLEAVTDLSTDSFLNALNRFVARRGLPNVLYSDNATNFVGAHRKLSKVYDFLAKTSKDPAVSEFLLSNSMQWKFIPPRSPHHGGLWEAAVKGAKFHLDRILNNNCLTFEQLATVFAQMEAIMNSRPLTPLSSDPSDLSVLTPGHFLIHYPLLSVPQVDLISVPSNRLTQYEGLQKLMQTFWRRWRKDYLQQLQTRTKWLESNGTPIREGTLVFLADENTPPLQWKRGRVTKLHPGSDGIVRSVTLRTATGDTTRAVQKLAVLPVDEDDSCWKSLPEASKARGMLRHTDNHSAPPVPCAVRPE
nr:unnamed protein product [Callosobruchus chinensis]